MGSEARRLTFHGRPLGDWGRRPEPADDPTHGRGGRATGDVVLPRKRAKGKPKGGAMSFRFGLGGAKEPPREANTLANGKKTSCKSTTSYGLGNRFGRFRPTRVQIPP